MAGSYHDRMYISYVLRLLPDELQQGRITGEVEAVASGQRVPVRSIDQLIAFVSESGKDEVDRTLAGHRRVTNGR